MVALEIRYNKENLGEDDALNLKEWLHILPSETFYCRLLPLIFRSIPRYQMFESDPAYVDMVANLADLAAVLVTRHREVRSCIHILN